MENTGFRSPWNPNPNRHGHRSFSPRERPKRRSPSMPKAVSDTKRKSAAAAVRIQSLLRGFLVRRKVGTVRRIEREVDEVERMIERDDEASIRQEEKERIRVNEMLMVALLRLDSVRGVRDYRRRVIRRVVLMQKKVDSLSEAIGGQETPGNREEMMEDQETLDICNAGAEEEAIKEGSLVQGPMKCRETLEFGAEDDRASLMEEDRSMVEAPKPSTEGCSGLKSVMERMAEENATLKGLVAELCERSALQCELMGGIMKKVEQLESTVQEMERRRRKKREANTALDSENN